MSPRRNYRRRTHSEPHLGPRHELEAGVRNRNAGPVQTAERGAPASPGTGRTPLSRRRHQSDHPLDHLLRASTGTRLGVHHSADSRPATPAPSPRTSHTSSHAPVTWWTCVAHLLHPRATRPKTGRAWGDHHRCNPPCLPPIMDAHGCPLLRQAGVGGIRGGRISNSYPMPTRARAGRWTKSPLSRRPRAKRMPTDVVECALAKSAGCGGVATTPTPNSHFQPPMRLWGATHARPPGPEPAPHSSMTPRVEA